MWTYKFDEIQTKGSDALTLCLAISKMGTSYVYA